MRINKVQTYDKNRKSLKAKSQKKQLFKIINNQLVFNSQSTLVSQQNPSHLHSIRQFQQHNSTYQQENTMVKQPQSIIEYTVQFVKEFNAFPFEDYYVFLVIRFLVYIYLFIKLSDILLGYEKPNLKTRVLRKFQFVYGEQILKQLDKDDMQQLEITITNTILNATKELSDKKIGHSNLKNSSKNDYTTRYDRQSQKSGKLYESERRQLRNEDGHESTGLNMSKKSLKLKFDLDKNQYFDPPSSLSSLIKLSEKQQSFILKPINDYEVQGESEEENLSPKYQNKISAQPNIQGRGQLKPQRAIELISKQVQRKISEKGTDFKDLQQNIYSQKEDNIHYSEKKLQEMELEIQEKLIKTEQNLLHLSDENLNASLMGNQPLYAHKNTNQLNSKSDSLEGEYDVNFPSIIKTQSTRMTDTLVEELDA